MEGSIIAETLFAETREEQERDDFALLSRPRKVLIGVPFNEMTVDYTVDALALIVPRDSRS